MHPHTLIAFAKTWRSCWIAPFIAAAITACSPARPPAGSEFQHYNDTPTIPVDTPYGLWNTARPAAQSKPDAKEQIEALNAIGYLAGSSKATATAGVTINDPRAQPGLNFYCSGHAPEAVLMDNAGTVLHTWRYTLEKVWPDYPFRKNVPKTGYWRRAKLLPDGSVLAIFEGIGIIKVDRDSKLIWAQRNGAHHALDVLPHGSIWVLTRVAHMRPEINAKDAVLEDFATLLDADGKQMQSFSLFNACERAADRDYFWTHMQPAGDLYHANDIQELDGSLAAQIPAFAKGNLLISSLYLNAIIVFNPTGQKAVWKGIGSWKRQHHAVLHANGLITLFDNRGGGPECSRVLELNPAIGRERSLYTGTKETPLYSWACGAAYPQPNGNLLIVESDRGRAFEVARDGKIVWEFVNPNRAGNDGQYIAALFDLERYPSITRSGSDWPRAALSTPAPRGVSSYVP